MNNYGKYSIGKLRDRIRSDRVVLLDANEVREMVYGPSQGKNITDKVLEALIDILEDKNRLYFGGELRAEYLAQNGKGKIILRLPSITHSYGESINARADQKTAA